MDALIPGTILLGKYRVEDVIGTGGMGRVVKASHLYLQQSVAIKILLPEMATSASMVSRFLREAQAAGKLKSEHVARVVDVGTLPDGTPLMVMEYLTGNDLNQILRHHGPQSPAIVCDLMLQACEGIAEAHAAGIVHRDVKPSNFFITQRPDGSMLLKILDFGISKTPVGVTELTGTQAVLGTPTYMAPEQMKSGRSADARSDIWSMGVVIYQMLTGRPPFGGESYAALVLQVNGEPPAPIMVPMPAGLGEVILRCLEKDPRNRHQNAGELARMLAPFASDPVAAALSAARTTRILQNKPGAQNALPLTAGGGLATPVPLSPAQLTPMSWPPSSVSQGTGQMTYETRSSRGWIVAAATALVILAGTGGFIINELTKERSSERRDEPYVQAPPPAPPTAAAGEPAAGEPAASEPAVAAPSPTLPPTPSIPPPSPTLPTLPEGKPEPTVAAKQASPEEKPEPTEKPAPEAKPAPAVKPPAPAPAARPAAKPPAPRPAAKPPAPRPAAKPPAPAPKPAAKPPKKGDDLFDRRD